MVAVEPSATMRAQRPPGAARAVAAHAEALPFADGAFDAAMAVLSDHHWHVRERGLERLRADLEPGAWARRNADLLALDELDLGLRLLVAGEVADRRPSPPIARSPP